MVARMMRWPPWPPVQSKKFRVKLNLLRLEAPIGSQKSEGPEEGELAKRKVLTAEVRWKGPKMALASLRRPSVKRNCTKAVEAVEEKGDVSISGFVPVVSWNEEFGGVCCLTPYKDHSYYPWEIAFSVLDSSQQSGASRKVSLIGEASLNLSEFVSAAEEQDIPVNILLASPTASSHPRLSLRISLSLKEINLGVESPAARSVVPMPLSPTGTQPEELSALKASLRKVKIFTDLVSSSRRSSKKEDDGGIIFDSSPDEEDEFGEEDEEEPENEEFDSMRKSFSYGTLASANHIRADDSTWFYYSGSFGSESFPETVSSSSSPPPSRRVSFIPWRKRKLGFRSPKSRGEPLLKKAYAEEGGDDIDHDRRQLSSDSESPSVSQVQSDFGDEDGGFAVGRWEEKQVGSRDGKLTLKAQVFFASMDQRSEEAGGESACAALVMVIADWLLRNNLPVKSQFDGLIRHGSREWRRLCQDSELLVRFPDKHFDLEAVLHSRVRPLSLLPAKSFIGFFHPEESDASTEPAFSFLSEAMSFDTIWEEVLKACGTYIVSWNDHFFVLKADEDAFYLIDTLGERLYEGCDQAYILKFDESSVITEAEKEGEEMKAAEVCKGKECCKEYIKRFLAAIPVRELLEDVKKGIVGTCNVPLHRRLQIEFHFAEPWAPFFEEDC